MCEVIERWRPLVTELPRFVTESSRSVSRGQSLYYPYWLVPVAMSVKLPFLPPREKLAEVAVDAFRGSASLAPRGGRERVGLPPNNLRCGVIPSFRETVDEGVVLRVAHSLLPSKLRMWGVNASEIGEARLVFKELRVFEVELKDEVMATLTLDTLSGEYGVVEKKLYEEAS